MDDYSAYLREHFQGEAVGKRLSHGDDAYARRRGDCHTDYDGTVQYPPVGHHHDDRSPGCGCSPEVKDGVHIDNSPHHIKCLAHEGYWLSWNRPTLEYDGGTITQGHRNVRGGEYLLNCLTSIP